MRNRGSRIAGSPDASPRQPRAYSPFNRSAGLRHLPDDRLGLFFVCSLILHAVVVILMLRVTDLPSGGGGAAIASVLSWVDLTAPEPARGNSGAASTPAARIMPRSASPAPAGPPRAAIAAATRPQAPIPPQQSSPVPSKIAQDQPTPAGRDAGVQGFVAGLPSMPEGDEPLGSARPGAASEVVAFDPKPSVVTSAVMLQPANTLTPIPTIDELAQKQRASLTPASPSKQALPFLEPTPKVESKPLADPQPAETRPETAPAPAGEPQVLTAALSSLGPAAPPAPLAEPSRDTPLPQQSTEPLPALTSPTSNRTPIFPVTSDPRTGSAVGVAPARVKVRFDGPRARVTHKDVETVTGKVTGGTTDRLLVYVNEVPMELAIGAGSFQTSVPLQPGLNQVRAIATGPVGLETEDSISIEYAPPSSPNGVALTSPADGFVVTPEDPPVVVVEGRVEDKSATTVWLVANDRRIPVRASEGRFRKILPVSEPTLRIWAETSRAGEPGSRSQAVTVYTTGPRRPTGVLVMEWPRGTQSLDVEVSALWRRHPERLDEPTQPVRLAGALKPSDNAPVDVFWLRNVTPGAYTMIIRYRGLPPDGEVHPILYLPDSDGLTARALRPVRLGAAGKSVLTRLLLPQGVVWEQDEWFSGTSESADTVTKFRLPEGITWVERKADL